MAASGQSRGAPSRRGLGHGAALRRTASTARIVVLGQGGGWGPRMRQARPQPSAYAALHTKEDSWKQHLAVVQGSTAPPAHGWMSQQALESLSRADTQSASCRRMMAPRWRLRGRGQGAGDENVKYVALGRLGAKAPESRSCGPRSSRPGAYGRLMTHEGNPSRRHDGAKRVQPVLDGARPAESFVSWRASGRTRGRMRGQHILLR